MPGVNCQYSEPRRIRMRHTINRLYKINRLALCFTFCLACSNAFAAEINQTDSNTQEQTRQQERLRQLRQQQEIKPDVRDAGEQLKTAAMRVGSAMRVSIELFFKSDVINCMD